MWWRWFSFKFSTEAATVATEAFASCSFLVIHRLKPNAPAFDAVGGDPECKAVPLVDLIQFVIHSRDLIQFSGNNKVLVSDSDTASKFQEKLVAAGFQVEP